MVLTSTKNSIQLILNKDLEQIENVLNSTMALISNCSCSNSCHACLRTYENRIFHEILDRKLAIELLKYVRNGNIPQIDTIQNEILANQLEMTLKLMMPTLYPALMRTLPITAIPMCGESI